MLTAAMKIRNAIVHGYKPVEFKPDTINAIIDFIENIMKQSDEALIA